MIKAFNSIKEIFLVFYQVLFVEAKERYEITEFYLEECGHNKKVRNLIKNDRRTVCYCRRDDGVRKLVMNFEDWWNTENKIEFSNEPDDYSKAKYVYEAVYNSMKNCLNCGKRRHCFLWHQANNFSKAIN